MSTPDHPRPDDESNEPPAGAAEPDPTWAPTEEETWDSIVAGYDSPDADPVGRWSVSEDLDTPTGTPPLAPATDRVEPEPADDLPQLEPADEGHYVPPPPPPIPVAHPLTLWAWVALLGGILLLVGSRLIAYELSAGWSLVAVLMIVGGFVTLVARMRDSPPTDSGPDDGAVV